MQYFKISIGIFLTIAVSRLIPHPPNFTSLIAISFYIPAIFGYRYIVPIILCFAITDLIIGFHSVILFTWGSVILIGLISRYFNKSIIYRVSGAFIGSVIFFVISNFGVWLGGLYGYDLSGFISCYILALPFFGYSVLSTLIFSVAIETIYKFYQKSFVNIYK